MTTRQHRDPARTGIGHTFTRAAISVAAVTALAVVVAACGSSSTAIPTRQLGTGQATGTAGDALRGALVTREDLPRSYQPWTPKVVDEADPQADPAPCFATLQNLSVETVKEPGTHEVRAAFAIGPIEPAPVAGRVQHVVRSYPQALAARRFDEAVAVLGDCRSLALHYPDGMTLRETVLADDAQAATVSGTRVWSAGITVQVGAAPLYEALVLMQRDDRVAVLDVVDSAPLDRSWTAGLTRTLSERLAP